MFKHVLVSAFLFSISLTIVGCASKDTENSKVTQDGIAKPISFWWPERLDLGPLRQHAAESNPYGDKFDYAKEFKKVNLDEVKKDITKALTTTQDWWPADWGNYGPFFIRMAWHSTGTYRVTDGRGGAGGGQQRFEPLNSWPDNANLDKARRLLWPVKAKYGRKLSWADIMVLAGNVSMESMGFKTLGFAGGRADDWEADLVYWGSETKMLDSNRHHHGKDYSKKDYKGKRKLKRPLGATRMGLIYVNPEGPNGNHDPLSSAADIRENFARMAMNDEETLALIAGGHTFGKAHGAHKPSKCVGAEPAAAGIEEQGLGWKNKCGKGHSEDTVTSGLEGAWTSAPTMWTHQYLTNLLDFEWEKTQSPAGATQWIPKNGALKNVVRDAHVKRKSTSPIMLTSDMALKVDPEYRKIAERFKKDPKEFELAFAKAWFKLTHRDMGPRTRYIGKDAPKIVMNWQDPVPAVNHSLIGSADIARLKKDILKSGLTTSELIRTAWASASSFRNTDMRGGANGARIQLAPQKDWAVNNPKELKRVLEKLKEVKKNFNKKVSLADVIVLGGTAAVENAAKKAGVRVNVSFKPGRTDATQSQTNIESFSNLEPKADAFRNYYSKESLLSPTQMLVDKANVLSLTIPEMTVLIGGMRVLSANVDGNHGVLTKTPGTLSNDFFVNLLDMSTKWRRFANEEGVYEGINRKSGTLEWTATPVDLIFGSHTELRAVAEVYAANDGKTKFVRDFAKAWSKVMQLDRFELK
jgi:catalase-peroxidase